jgi:hypothetical protein
MYGPGPTLYLSSAFIYVPIELYIYGPGPTLHLSSTPHFWFHPMLVWISKEILTSLHPLGLAWSVIAVGCVDIQNGHSAIISWDEGKVAIPYIYKSVLLRDWCLSSHEMMAEWSFCISSCIARVHLFDSLHAPRFLHKAPRPVVRVSNELLVSLK